MIKPVFMTLLLAGVLLFGCALDQNRQTTETTAATGASGGSKEKLAYYEKRVHTLHQALKSHQMSLR